MKPTPYADIPPVEPEWFWPGRIPFSETTLIAGDGGIGKGFLLADLASRATRGAAMPDGSSQASQPGSVLLVTSEDDPNMAMAYRLRAAGADLSRVYDMTEDFIVGHARRGDSDSIPALRETIASIGDVRLVVIDPLSAVAAIALTSSNVRVRREIMNPLERVAKDTGVALVLVHHTVKSGNVAGTKGITDAARMVLRVSRAPQDERIRLIHVEKTNIANAGAGDVAYTVSGQFPDVRVQYLEAPEDPAEVKAPTVADNALAYLASTGKPADAQTISQAIGAGYAATRVALTRLKASGQVSNPARGIWVLATPPGDLRVVSTSN